MVKNYQKSPQLFGTHNPRIKKAPLRKGRLSRLRRD